MLGVLGDLRAVGDAFDCPDSGPAGDQLPHPAETGSETPRCHPSPGDGRPYLCHLLFPERLSFHEMVFSMIFIG